VWEGLHKDTPGKHAFLGSWASLCGRDPGKAGSLENVGGMLALTAMGGER